MPKIQNDFLEKMIDEQKNLCIIYCVLGGIAQLARVLDWQSRGHGFESHYLHHYNGFRFRNPFFIF